MTEKVRSIGDVHKSVDNGQQATRNIFSSCKNKPMTWKSPSITAAAHTKHQTLSLLKNP